MIKFRSIFLFLFFAAAALAAPWHGWVHSCFRFRQS